MNGAVLYILHREGKQMHSPAERDSLVGAQYPYQALFLSPLTYVEPFAPLRRWG